MTESGLRSSCDTMARNSSFRLLASQTASSARFRLVISMQTPTSRNGSPPSPTRTFPLPSIQRTPREASAQRNSTS